MPTQMHALMPMSLLLLLSGCGTTTVIEKPVPVEVIKVERVPVPQDLLSPVLPGRVPDGLSFAEALEMWVEDRQTIDTLNDRLRAIESLQ